MSSVPYPTVLVKRLLQPLVDVPVEVRIPKERPEVFVRLDCSPPTLYEAQAARQCVVIVQAYAPKHQTALSLLERIEVLLDQHLLDADSVLGWEQITSPAEESDPDRPGVMRWQFTGMLYQALT